MLLHSEICNAVQKRGEGEGAKGRSPRAQFFLHMPLEICPEQQRETVYLYWIILKKNYFFKLKLKNNYKNKNKSHESQGVVEVLRKHQGNVKFRGDTRGGGGHPPPEQ